MFDALFTSYKNLDQLPVKRNTNTQAKLYLENFDTQFDDLFEDDLEDDFNLSSQSDNNKSFFSDIDFYEDSYEPEVKKKVTLKGNKKFEQAFAKAVEVNPNVAKYKNFLVKTAKRESGFNSYIQNTAGAPYYGYFQMGKEEITMTTGMSVEEFRNNPVAQILGACKLYEMNLRTIKKIGVYDLGKQKGYSDDALVAGAWMGGPGGVKKYLLGQGDPSDSHWYKDGKGGSSVGKIMNNWMKGK